MIPISDENPVLRTPIANYTILALIFACWILLQGAGLSPRELAVSVCNLGMVPAELTGRAPLGTAVPIGPGLACVVDAEPVNLITPLTSMFLHGGWGHILGNCLFLWVFGNNVEDSMGRLRYVAFYLICGLAAAATHVLVDPASPIPTVGASGAISGVLGAYLVLYPRVHVRLLVPIVFFITIVRVRAWVVLVLWFVFQLLAGLPQLMALDPEVSGGVAVWAHVGGFVAGALLVKLFEDRTLVRRRVTLGEARART
ncbi:MAG TPA: rhomboid family intramembrane serine protease [Gemmatimonadaceae bacterium]|nr:rhomboid family intramembrane serine protease [Gemmatimonadaceae bacterium]